MVGISVFVVNFQGAGAMPALVSVTDIPSPFFNSFFLLICQLSHDQPPFLSVLFPYKSQTLI